MLRVFAATFLALLAYAGTARGQVHLTDVPTDRIIVRMKPGAAPPENVAKLRGPLARRLTEVSGEAIEPYRVMGDGAQVMRLSRRMRPSEMGTLLGRMGQDPDVLEALPDRLAFPALLPGEWISDTAQPNHQWYLSAAEGINAPAAWDITTGSANTVVAVVDTGILNHTEFAGRVLPGYDFVSTLARANDGDLRDSSALDPGDWLSAQEAATPGFAGCPVQPQSRWHGTAMAGVIAANANNGVGLAGVDWNAKILPVRVVGKCGGYTSDIADGIRWAAGVSAYQVPANPNPASVINLSLAADGACDSVYQAAIDEAVAKGAVVVVASGNSAQPAALFSPGSCRNVITVGAVGRDGSLATYGNSGPEVAISAPGGSLISVSQGLRTAFDSGLTAPANDSAYAHVFGSSVSAALISGVASLMKAVNPSLSPVRIKELIQLWSKRFSNTASNPCNVALCGQGIVDARAAVRAAINERVQIVGSRNTLGHTLLLRSDGSVWRWGEGSGIPVQVPGISGVVQIAQGVKGDSQTGPVIYAGATRTALRANGTVWDLTSGTPTQVLPLKDIVSIAAGWVHDLALRSDGTVWGYGWDFDGSLGGIYRTDGYPIRVLPSQLAPVILQRVERIAAGSFPLGQTTAIPFHGSLAIRNDGLLFRFGGKDGNAGFDTEESITGFTQIAPDSHLAVRADGTVWNLETSPPARITGLSEISEVATGEGHGVALKFDGTVWTWGQNTTGQLGDGTTTSRASPAPVPGLVGVVRIGAGRNYSLAVKADGSVHAWGGNGDGQLGDGTLIDRWAPTRVVGSGGVGFLSAVVDTASFFPQFAVPTSSVRISNAIVVAGATDSLSISISGAGGAYRIDSGAFTSAPGTVNRGQRVTLQAIASSSCSTAASVTLTIAGVPRDFVVTTVDCEILDTEPRPFGFTRVDSIAPGAVVTSNTVTITGISQPASISVTGGEYSIGCSASFTTATSVIATGQSVCVRLVAPQAFLRFASATLTVGSVSAPFIVVTSPDPDFRVMPAVIGDGAFGVGLASDGRVWRWSPSQTPVLVSDPSKVATQIAGGSILYADGTVRTAVTGYQSSLSEVTSIGRGYAVRADGTVWTHGGAQVANLSRMASVSEHVGLTQDGSAWYFEGSTANPFGYQYRTGPVLGLASNGVKIRGFALQGLSALPEGRLLTSNGEVWSWGYANVPSLVGCNPGMFQDIRPCKVEGLTGVVDIATGQASTTDNHTLALKADGTVSGFGGEFSWIDGQFGRASRGEPIPGLPPMIGVGAEGKYSYGLASDGTVYWWGNRQMDPLPVPGENGIGLLRLLTRGVRPQPFAFLPAFGAPYSSIIVSNPITVAGLGIGKSVPITVINGAYSKNGGAYTASPDSVANGDVIRVRLTSSPNPETLTSASVTISGVAGESSTFHVFTRPATSRIPNTPRTALGASHSIVLNPTGVVFGFGYNANGQLGNGTTFSTPIPTPVGSLYGIVQVASGSFHSLATKDGLVWAWGFNGGGQLGSDAGPSALKPLQVPGLDLVTSISAGGAHSLARRGDGSVRAWGLNTSGQLGTGSSQPRVTTPTAVNGLPSIAVVSAGGRHSLALASSGQVYAWGANESGQLGDGSTSQKSIPISVPGLSDVAAIAACGAHSLALKRNGTVWGWGSNAFGQLGVAPTDPNDPRELVPRPVSTLGSDVALIACGDNHSLAVRAGGRLYSWGANNNGQLGDGTTSSRTYPALLATPVSVVAVSGGGRHTAATDADGRAHVFGDNFFGQVGNKSGNYSPHSSSLDILRGDSVIVTGASGTGTGVGSGSTAGSAIVQIGGIATGFDFGSLAAGTARTVSGSFGNAAASGTISNIGITVNGTGFALVDGESCPTSLAPGESCTFTVQFAPQTAGTTEGELQVASSLVGSPERRSLSGTAALANQPVLAVEGTAGLAYLTFVPQLVGSASAPLTVKVTNRGTATLVTTGVTVDSGSGDFFVANGCGSALAPAATCNVSIAFVPSAQGERTGRLAVATNAGTQYVTLSGSGAPVPSPPAIHVLSVAKFGSGSGTVTSTPFGIDCGASCIVPFPAGSSIALTALPAAGSALSGWSGACSSAGACNVTMDAAKSVAATFSRTQTIAFAQPANRTFGEAPFVLAATASSGFIVTMTTATPTVCTVLGNTVTIVGAGTCTINADQGGDAATLPAPQVSRSFTVAKAAQAISFGALGNKVMGSAPFPVSATGGTSGNTVNFASSTPASCTVLGSTVTLVAAGTCTITASQPGNANYLSAAPVSQSFTVLPAGSLAITSPNVATFTVGSPGTFKVAATGSPVPTLSVTGGLPLGVTFTPATGALAGTPALGSAGNYPLTFTASNGMAINAVQPFTLTVAKIAQSITFGALANRQLGDAPFTVSATGGVSGNPVTFASSTPATCTVSGNTVTLLAGGTCTITASQPGDANYAPATPFSQSFQVTVAVGIVQTSVTTLNFGGQSMNTTAPSQSVTITNGGGAPITISSVAATTYFAATHDCPSTPLAPAASCTASVTFTPKAEGSLNGTLTITSNAVGSPNTVSLTGTGERSLVTHYYRSILRRAPDAGGKAFWESEKVRLPSLGANVNETWYAMATFFYFSSEYQSFNRDDAGFVTDLYNTFFNRPADGGGLTFWTGLLAQGMPREVVLVSFMFSTEFQGFTQAIFGNVLARKEVDTVVDFYRGLLSRLPDDGGLASWVGQFRAAQCQGAGSVYTTVEAISSGFANGGEYAARNRTNAQYVGDLYNAFLRRGGDLGGVQFWISQLTGGATRSAIRQQFIASPEFTNRVNAIIAEGCLPP